MLHLALCNIAQRCHAQCRAEHPYQMALCNTRLLGQFFCGEGFLHVFLHILHESGHTRIAHLAGEHLTAEAAAQGLGTCILGWFDDDEIRKICDLDGAVRLVITIGYPKEDSKLRPKKRKEMDELGVIDSEKYDEKINL